MSHKFNLVTAYHIEDEPQVDRAMSKQMNSGVNFQVNGGVKDNYEYWPLFKHAETPTNKVAKRKLYSHLVVSNQFKLRILLFFKNTSRPESNIRR